MFKVVCILFIVYILSKMNEGFTTMGHNHFHCPHRYRKNMVDLENTKKKMHYGGYTDNEYIDMTRFINTDTEPLPVNADFF